MGFTITVSQKAPLVDPVTGDPIPTAGTTGPMGDASFPCMIVDEGGFLVCVANSVGSVLFQLVRDGVEAGHSVQVVADPTPPPATFDWTLGTPVAK